jgi:hypothetical protein
VKPGDVKGRPADRNPADPIFDPDESWREALRRAVHDALMAGTAACCDILLIPPT